MVNSDDFAKRLEKIFLYYDLNASSFAEKIDVGRASISHLLSGRNKPSLDFVLKVVKTFPEVELYWLLNGKGKFPENEQSTPISKSRATPTPQRTERDITETKQNPIVNPVVQNEASSNLKTIKRIIIFYDDGTFEAFNHS